jgi:hypothetical protein
MWILKGLAVPAPHLRLDLALCLATAIPIGYRAATLAFGPMAREVLVLP